MAPVFHTFVTGRTVVLFISETGNRQGSGFGRVCNLALVLGVVGAGNLSRKKELIGIWV